MKQARAAAPGTRFRRCTPHGVVHLKCLVFTSPRAMYSAARVARHLARALAVPLTLIVFRTRQHGQPPAVPDHDEDVNAFVERLRADGDTVTTRVYVCHSMRQTIPFALSPRSLVVVGGRRSWLPTQTERLRRALERAHHLVIIVAEPGNGAPAAGRDGDDKEVACRSQLQAR